MRNDLGAIVPTARADLPGGFGGNSGESTGAPRPQVAAGSAARYWRRGPVWRRVHWRQCDPRLRAPLGELRDRVALGLAEAVTAEKPAAAEADVMTDKLPWVCE